MPVHSSGQVAYRLRCHCVCFCLPRMLLLQVSVDLARSFLALLKSRFGSESDPSKLWSKLQEAKSAFTSQLASGDTSLGV